MANTSRPNGASLVGTLDGSPVSGGIRERDVAAGNATAIFAGDFMILNDDGTVSPYTGTGGGNLLGVCMGVVVNRAVAATEHPGYLPASTAGVVLVAEGPQYLYEVQVNGTALDATAIGSNANVKATAGSTTTGMSRHELDATTLTDSSPASAQLRVIEMSKRVDNEVGSTYDKVIVKINKHIHMDATGL